MVVLEYSMLLQLINNEGRNVAVSTCRVDVSGRLSALLRGSVGRGDS